MPKCLNCGDEFKYRFRSNEKFCSSECCHKYHNEAKKATSIKVCEICGKKLNGFKKKYCSDECRYKSQLERQRNKYETELKSIYSEEKTLKKKRGRPKKKISLAEINKLAREEGLNYGQYVAKYGL